LFSGACAPNNYSRSPRTGVVGLVALSVGPQSRVAIQRPGERARRGEWAGPIPLFRPHQQAVPCPWPSSCSLGDELPTNTNTELGAVIKLMPSYSVRTLQRTTGGGVNSLLSVVSRILITKAWTNICTFFPNSCCTVPAEWEIRYFLFPQDATSSSKQETF
jgi:hypothetical protein